MNIRMFFIWLGVFIAFAPIIVSINFTEEVVVGEITCVDGSHNKNLAGIMCEDTKLQTFGMSEGMFILSISPICLLGLFIFFKALYSEDANHGGNE